MTDPVRRNDPCPCGSGKKFKSCCAGSAPPAERQRTTVAVGIAVAGLVVAAVVLAAIGATAAKLIAGVSLLLALGYWFLVDPPSSRTGNDPGGINFGN
jgi:hypothetical protein